MSRTNCQGLKHVRAIKVRLIVLIGFKCKRNRIMEKQPLYIIEQQRFRRDCARSSAVYHISGRHPRSLARSSAVYHISGRHPRSLARSSAVYHISGRPSVNYTYGLVFGKAHAHGKIELIETQKVFFFFFFFFLSRRNPCMS